MFSKRHPDIVDGPLLKTFIRYSIPIILSALISDCFQMVDTMVLAQKGDMTSVAAIGAVGTVISLIVTSFTGLSQGAVILLAQAIGAQEKGRIKKIVNTALFFASALGIVSMGIGIAFSPVLPSLVNCPESCYANASTYLLLYFCTAPAILIYNFSAAAIRAQGDSTRPAIYIVVAGALNVVLDILLCDLLTNKVVAVAIASLGAQCVGAVLSVIHLQRIGDEFRLQFSRNTLDFAIFRRVLAIGLPCAFTTAIFSIGNLPVVRTLNSFDAPVIAGSNASCKIEALVSMFGSSFGSATMTFVGQNYGAGRFDRVRRVIFHASWLSFGTALLLSALTLAFRYPLISLFISGGGEAYGQALEAGVWRMYFVITLECISALKSVFLNTTQALGHTLPSTIINFVAVLALRAAWITWVYPHFQTIQCIYACFSVSWIVSFLAATAVFVYFCRTAISKKAEQLRAEKMLLSA